jgi:hypothetical protein
MVMMFGGCEPNTILVLPTRSMALSPSMQVALANGHCEATFASIKLLGLTTLEQKKHNDEELDQPTTLEQKSMMMRS